MNTQTPDLVPQIAAEIVKEKSLSHWAAKRYREQIAARTSGYGQAVRKMQVAKHRRRVRQNSVGDCSIGDTRKSSDGTRLYFELSNGQAVRADRATDHSVRELHEEMTNGDVRITLLRVKGRRKKPFHNAKLIERIVAEVEKNANREATTEVSAT